MSFAVKTTAIPGCFELLPKIVADERGTFVKTFHRDMFLEHGLETNFAEEYYSRSAHGVLRGLHFQLPPQDHVKIVYCVDGEVLDAVVDLRIGSPTYGTHQTFSLSGEKANMLYIPAGLAHGFYVTGSHATMMYKVTTVYSPEHDAGIHWQSAGIPWPVEQPVVSLRDARFAPLAAFESPFRYGGGE
jgi:dTDP-4-dehydrorhamnose 3,5-epimerase